VGKPYRLMAESGPCPHSQIMYDGSCYQLSDLDNILCQSSSSVVDAHQSRPQPVEQNGAYSQVTGTWVEYWSVCTRARVLLDVHNAHSYCGLDPSIVQRARWEYAMSHGNLEQIRGILDNETSRVPNTVKATRYVARQVQLHAIRRNLEDSLDVRLSGLPDGKSITAFADFISNLAAKYSLFDHDRWASVVDKKEFNEAVAMTCAKFNLASVMLHFVQSNDSCVITALNETINSGQYPQWLTALVNSACADLEGSQTAAALASLDTVSASTEKEARATVVLAAILYSDIPLMTAVKEGLVKDGVTLVSPADTKVSIRGVPFVASHVDALCKQLGRGSTSIHDTAPRVTVYDILRGASFQNVLDGLSFQETNRFGATSGETMPHFSRASLTATTKFDALDYKYYLQQGRPLHAHDVFKKSMATGTSVSAPEDVTRAVRELAITNFYDRSVSCACLMFLDMMHEDKEASLLRDDLAVAERIFRYESRQFKASGVSAHIAADSPGLAASLARVSLDPTAHSREVNALAQRLDAATIWSAKMVKSKSRPTQESSRQWELVCRFGRRFGLPPSTTFLETCADADDWILFLGFAQSECIPLDVVQEVAKGHFRNENLKAHIELSLKSMILEDVGRFEGNGQLLWLSKGLQAYAHGEASAGSFDLFDLVFQCEASEYPFATYLSSATRYRLPQLAALGACIGKNKLAVICSWLLASISDSARNSLVDKVKFDRVTDWSRADFITIVEQVARSDGMHLLVEGLSMVMGPEPTSTPLKQVASFHTCFKAFDFTAATTQLHDFKNGSERLSVSGSSDDLLNSPAVVHETADAVIQVLLEGCDNSHESEHLLRLLSQANYSKHYVHLHQTYMIMNSVGMNSSEYDSPESCVSALLERGLFNEARSYAQAHQLSEDTVTLKEVEAKLQEYENSRLWSLEKTRLDVWKQFQSTFVDRHCAPDVAGGFFLSRVQNDRGGDMDQPGKFYTTPETVMLLKTALMWLDGSVSGTKACQIQIALEDLQTLVWKLRIDIEVAFSQRASGKADAGTRMLSAVASCVRSGEDSFVRNGTLEPGRIRGWGTKEATLIDSWRPKDSHDALGPGAIPLVSTAEERQALDALIGALLIEGDLIAASMLAGRFQYHSRDLLLAITAFELANETIAPATAGARLQEFTSEKFADVDTLQALRILCQYCGPGEDCCRRLMTNYTVTRTLNMSYKAMLAQEALKVLRHLVRRGPLSFDLAQQFISRNKLAKSDVSQLLGLEYVSHLSASDSVGGADGARASSPTYANWSTWGQDEFSQFANLSDPGILGMYLLETVYSDKPVIVDEMFVEADDEIKLNPEAEVTVLCRAHYCFILACNTDAIDHVLVAAQDLTRRFVAQRLYQPLIRLLTSVKRYRDMEYIFDALVDNDRFELLLAKDRMAGDAVGVAELKAALRDYLLRKHPKDTEKLQMVSLHFTMYREIGENRLANAQQHIRALGKSAPGAGKLKDLLFIIQMLAEAAQNLMTEECQRKARKCLTLARLVGLQVQMVDVPLLNLDRHDVSQFLLQHPLFPESLVVAQAYEQCTSSDWIPSLYAQVVQRGNFEYFEGIRSATRITTGMYKELAAIFLRDPARNDLAVHFQTLLCECPDIFVRHGLAKEVGLFTFAASLEEQHGTLVRT